MVGNAELVAENLQAKVPVTSEDMQRLILKDYHLNAQYVENHSGPE